MTSQKITEIIAAKAAAGTEAYLWVHDSGDCILWPSEAASENDDASRALARWSLTPAQVDDLIASCDCDEVA